MDAGAVWFSLPLGVMCVHRAAVWFAVGRGALGQAHRLPGKSAASGALALQGEGRTRAPVTWLRPLKAGVPGLGEKLARFVEIMCANDEAIFGVEVGSEEERLCAELAARDGRVKVVVCDAGAAANPKVAKLIAMTPCARHERWILADAEARIDAEFASAFRDEWEWTGADALTAGYRFVGMGTWVQWLDALAVVQTLWPGLELVRAFGRVRFTLGACTGVRRVDVESIGGWAVLGAELAEDQQLGARLAAAGKTVRISEAVLDLESEPMTWRDYWRHQRRVAVTYRVAAPAGALGMILTRGFTICLMLAAVWPGWLTLGNAALAAAIHVLAVAVQGRRQGERAGGWVGLSLIADVVETVCWGLSWGSSRVWWGGKWRLITRRGQFRDAKSEAMR